MREIKITDGPAKPDLQWAVSYPEKHLHIHFATDADPLIVHLDQMQEIADGTEFELKGHIVSEPYKNKKFTALYDLESKTGVLEVAEAEAPLPRNQPHA